MNISKASTRFQLTGKIQQLIPDRGSDGWKALDLQLASGLVYRLKLDKDLRSASLGELQVGQQVWIDGYHKPGKHGGMPKLKALNIELEELRTETLTSLQAIAPDLPKPNFRLQVCSKGSCRKRGAEQLQRQLESWAQDHGLAEQIIIQTTGCLKDCKKGPNVRLLPLGKQLSGFSPELLKVLNKQFNQ
jgi:hypothetical protein